MAGMPEAAKIRLREIAQTKRKAKTLAKDYEVTDYLIALDWVLENESNQVDVSPTYFAQTWHPGRTLKYMPDGVIDALAKHLPHVQVRYGVGRGGVRETVVLPNNVVVHILEVLKLSVEKYSTFWNENNIQVCRTDEQATFWSRRVPK